jgi:single-strand DNA-binding protein
MKHITIAGGLTRDAELRRSQGGDPILGFSVGVSEGRDKPSTYFDCSLFGKRAEALEQYLKKGGKVTVCGDFSTREHNGKTYLQVRVSDVTLQGGNVERVRDDDRGQDPTGYQDRRGGFPAGGTHNPMDDGDLIPFAPW